MKQINIAVAVPALAVALLGSGCSTMMGSSDSELESRLQRAEARNAELEKALRNNSGTTQVQTAPMSAGGDMLPKAAPGECYARVFVPPTYKTETKKVLKSAASEKIEIIPGEYTWVEEKVLVKPAGEKIVEVVPAQYKTVKEKMLVKAASYKLMDVPAKYDTVEEKILVRPAYTTWKQGRGPIEKIDNETGEIMCMVEVPAEYKTIKKRVLVQQAGTKKVEIPAEYGFVEKQVMVRPSEVKKVAVPAQYKTVKVRKEVRPAQEKRIPIPAEYQTITQEVKVTEGRNEWRSILCETNMDRSTVADLQRALKAKGYNPGPIDGVIGSETATAVRKYQTDNKLARGQITMETLRSLGVQPRGLIKR